MSDLFKWMIATILHYALITSPMLMAQETPPVENQSAQRTEAIQPATANKPPQATESEATQPKGIYLELPADPALVGTFRRLAEALSMKYKIQILDAGTSASGPELIEAELRLTQDAEFDKVEKIFGILARFKVARVQLFGSFEDQNMIVINAPANASWKLIHDMETDLAKLEDFRFDIRVRANENPPIPPFTDSGTIPDLFGFGESESHIPPESPMPSNASVPTVAADEEKLKIFHLQNSDANQIAAVIEQLFGGEILTVAVDVRTNSLIVRSNEPLLQQIEAILLRLDEQPGKQAPIVSSTTGTAANSRITITPDATSTSEPPIVPIAEYRRRLNELEQLLLQLAEKVRSAEASLGKEHPESLKQRASLRESIQNTFATRQEIQRAEVAEFARRLRRMQQSIDSRNLIADKIVERRLDELLNPDAKWDSALSDTLKASNTKVARSGTKPATTETAPAPTASITANSVEAEITLTIRGEERKVFYWHGFPIDGTNTAVVARENFRPNSNAKQMNADAEIFQRSIESISVIVGTRHGIRALPAKLERINPDLGLLLLSVEQEYVFKSLPFDPVGPAAGQKFKTDAQSGTHYMLAQLTEISPGVSHAELYPQHRSKWCGSALTGLSRQRFLGLAITLPGESPEESYGIISAPAFAKWLDMPISTIGIHLMSDQNLDLTIPGEPTRVSSNSATFDIRANQTSQLQLSRIQGADDLEVRMAIEPRYSSPEALQFLQHNDMVIEVKDADIAQLKEGNMVSKALYTSPGSTLVSTIASFALDAGIDPVDVAAGHGTVIGVIRMSRSISGEFVSERIPQSATVSSAEGSFFSAPAWSPKSDAEKAISRLVLVFFEDKARRAVPAVLIQHGQETIALTTSPATIVPENIEHAIDRTFLEFFDRENVPTTYADFSTPDLVLHVAKEQLTSFQLENPVTLRTGDVLSAILMHGQADLEVTPNAARVTAVEQKTIWQLPSHEINREFTGLIQIDQRLPEGTPLFKDGQLAGITLLGTRFMKDEVPGSYVVPASRIVELLQQLRIE